MHKVVFFKSKGMYTVQCTTNNEHVVYPGSLQCDCADNTVHCLHIQGVYSVHIILYMVYQGSVQCTVSNGYGGSTVHLDIEWKGWINTNVFLCSKSITGLILYRI